MTPEASYYQARAEGYRKLALYHQSAEAERFVQVGMRAVIRDMQEFIRANRWTAPNDWVGVDVDELEAYLLTMLVTAGGYDEEPGSDGQS